MSRFRKFSLHCGLFAFLIISTLLIRLSNANATPLDFTSWDFSATTTNAIAPNGGTGTPINTNTGGQSTFVFSPQTSITYPIDAIYSTSLGAITSDITTQGNISNTTGAITFNHTASITNTFPTSSNYGVGAYSFINFQGSFTGNGSEITLPLSFNASFSNNSNAVVNGTSDFFVNISSSNANLASYGINNFGTGSGFLKDLTFPTVAGDAYTIFAYSQLSGDVLGNASADLTLLIGAPISQTPVSATPEPPTLWLMASGILGMFGWTGYRRVKPQV